MPAAVAHVAPADPHAGLDPADREWLRGQTVAALGLCRRSAEDMLALGAVIGAVRDRIGHGRYLPWVRDELRLTQQSAHRMMTAAAQFGNKPHIVRDLTPTALYLLAQPSTPERAREKALELAEAGHALPYEAVRNLIGECRVGGLLHDPPAADPADPPPPTRPAPAGDAARGWAAYEALTAAGRLDTDRVADPDGGLWYETKFHPADDTLDVLVERGRDRADALARLRRRADAARLTPDQARLASTHYEWAERLAYKMAAALGVVGSQQVDDLRAAGRAAVAALCLRFDPARNPLAAETNAFRGWAKKTVRSEAVREAKRLRNGGTYSTRRENEHEPLTVTYLEPEGDRD